MDHNHLKSKSLSEVFPPLCLFPQVSHSVHSRRIAVGTRSGQLALYEMRSSKVQTLPGVHGGGPVLAVAYSPEGKHLATYSAADNRLHFWQTSTGMFGLGNAQTKCNRSYNTPPLASNVQWNTPTYTPKLVWISARYVAIILKISLIFSAVLIAQSQALSINIVLLIYRTVTLLLPDGAEHRFNC